MSKSSLSFESDRKDPILALTRVQGPVTFHELPAEV